MGGIVWSKFTIRTTFFFVLQLSSLESNINIYNNKIYKICGLASDMGHPKRGSLQVGYL